MLNLMSTFAIGDVNIAIIDAIALGILLIFFIIGMVKGFFHQVLSLLGWVAAIVIAVLTCTHVATFISDSFPDLVTTVNGWWNGLVSDSFNGVTDEASLRAALETSTIPAFLHESIVTLVGQEFTTIVDTIVNTLTSWFFIAVSFILIFLVALIVFKIIKGIFNKLTELPVIKQVDKLLGGILGLVEGLALLIVATVLLTGLGAEWFNALLVPMVDGEPVTCIFNELMNFVLNLPLIQEALASIALS